LELEFTYDFFEDIDLVKEHALLVVIHMTLPQHLDSSLCACLPMYTHSYFTERA